MIQNFVKLMLNSMDEAYLLILRQPLFTEPRHCKNKGTISRPPNVWLVYLLCCFLLLIIARKCLLSDSFFQSFHRDNGTCSHLYGKGEDMFPFGMANSHTGSAEEKEYYSK